MVFKQTNDNIEELMGLNQQPLISIIIPVYNVEKYLEDSIESIRNQTYQNIEIICINDGSTDSSLKILESYARQDSRIRVISQENHGASSARNTGFTLAEGEYVYFFDSDDMLSEEAMQLIINAFNLYNSDIIFFGGTAIYETEELEEKYPHYQTLYQRNATYPEIYTGSDIFVNMINNHDLIVSVCFQCFRREFLIENQITFHEGIIHEDNLFSIISLISSKKVYHLEKNLYIRQVRNNSIMTSKTHKDSFNGYFICIIELIKFSHLNYDLFTDSLTSALGKQLNIIQDRITKLLSDFEGHVIDRPVFSDPYKELIAQLIFDNMLRINNIKKDKLKLQKQIDSKKSQLAKAKQQYTEKIEDLQNSASYKIGRAITFLPRKIKSIFKHLN